MPTDEPAPRPLTRNRDFLLLWGGQTVSEVGSQVSVLALPLVALVVLKASALQVALLSAATTSAFLLVALPAGVLVDRLSRRRVMLWCDLGRVVLVGSLPVAQVAGVLTVGQLYGVALASSVLTVFFSVAYQSYLPALIDRSQLMEGNGKLSTSQSAAQIAGPGLGAALVGVVGAAKSMIGDAASYGISALTLLAIRRGEPAPEPEQAVQADRPRMRAQIKEGLVFVAREPILRRAAAWSGSANFFVIMVESLGPVFLVRTLHLRPGYVGLMLAAGACGGVVGGLASGRLARTVGSARISWLSMTVFALPGLLIPASGAGWLSLLFAVGWTSWTFSATVCGVALTSYRQAMCPPELLGRVNAASRWITWGTLPLGGVVGGALAATLGVRTSLWIATIGGCLSGLWLFFSPLRGMRDIPTAPTATPRVARVV
ncbi:major facilitator superfamily MFS_1 [Catenulispora acidiphila DSM 44928]|uniref:Major facilitator superfamily MFS_1 n=1 Tax=Catenulispora acidiphila (strain DSM 44928 / JCM 14897 / NBRC 102108 / NRRL B-24433 / ID139908) TaxID=479433 RepID=C7PXK5_CATAD|nr:MFS transporter [Catenulispora acidiphila]ACU71458.1 major facilitator superfamily MFS_1 [Catenulispora acidiphila DSM 44928]